MHYLTVEETVLYLVRQQNPKIEPKLESRLSDLGFDSLDRYELASSVEDFLLAGQLVFDAQDEVFRWLTVQDVVDSAKNHMHTAENGVVFSQQ